MKDNSNNTPTAPEPPPPKRSGVDASRPPRVVLKRVPGNAFVVLARGRPASRRADALAVPAAVGRAQDLLRVIDSSSAADAPVLRRLLTVVSIVLRARLTLPVPGHHDLLRPGCTLFHWPALPAAALGNRTRPTQPGECRSGGRHCVANRPCVSPAFRIRGRVGILIRDRLQELRQSGPHHA